MRKVLRAIWRVITAPIRGVASSFQTLHAFFVYEPPELPLVDVIQAVVQNPGSTKPHLESARRHLLRSALYLILATVASFVYTPTIIDFLAKPIGGITKLQAIDVTEPVSVFMRVALLSGFTLALPFIAFEVYRFFIPGLSGRERLWGILGLPVASFLFVCGLLFAYYVMLPTALPFLLNFGGMTTIARPSSYSKFVTGLLFWIGVSFEYPLIIMILASLHLVKVKTLVAQWRIAVVVIAVIAAIITPTVDPINMGLVMGPMILLYFVGISLAYLVERRKKE